MDFRPTTNTLIANYLITFAIVGIVVFLSLQPGKVVSYYYSPEYQSHASYGTSNCASCHTTAWSKVTDKNCSTAGCHTSFVPGTRTTPERLATKIGEFKHEKPHFGAILAFHDKVMNDHTCEVCHPSHRLPQKGLFNSETILVAMQQAGGIPPDIKARQKSAAELFHAGAEKFTGKMNCQACHADMNAAGESISNAAAAEAAAQLSAIPPAIPESATVPPTSSTPAETSTVAPTTSESTSPTGHIATGDIMSMPPLGAATSSPATPETAAATPATDAATTSSPLPNLFEATEKVRQKTAPTDDGAVQMPN
jgi:hypothetical protein